MKFSVLIPVYNVENYLQQCLDSVINQTFDDYEIIVVDDGSNDNSPSLCDGFKKKYPNKVTVIHKENQGLISARRVAIEKAQGEFCVFVDSDDYIECNLLETISEYTLSEETDIIMFSLFSFSDEGEKAFPKEVSEKVAAWGCTEKKEIYEMLINNSSIDSLCTKAIRTDILRKDPLDYTQYYKYNMSEDTLQLLYPLTYARKVVFTNHRLYGYRFNQKSISRSFNCDTIEKKNSLYVYKEFLNILPKWNMYDEEHINKLKNRWLNETIYLFSKFYENAKNNKEIKQVVNFNWDSFLPADFSIEELKDCNPNSVLLYKKIKEKDYLFLKLYFLKKGIYKKYKNLKARLKK